MSAITWLYRSPALAYGVAALVTVVTAPLSLATAGTPQDEGAVLVYGVQVLHGAVAHRDFQTFYGPGMPWLLSGLFVIFGASMLAERLLGLFLHIVVSLLIARIGGRWGRWQGVASGVISAACLLPLGPMASPWLAGVAIALIGIMAMDADHAKLKTLRGIAIGGGAASIAVTFRPDLAPAVLLASAPFLVGDRARLRAYVVGGCVGAVPILVHLAAASPAAVFQNVIVDAVLRQSAGRRLPLPSPGTILGLALVITVGIPLMAALVTAVRLRTGRGDRQFRLLASLSLFSLGFVPEVLQRADLPHVLTVGCVCLAILPVILTAALDPSPWARLVRPSEALIALGVISATASMVLGGVYLYRVRGNVVGTGARSFIVSRSEYAATSEALALARAKTRPGQRLIVGPLDMRRTNYTATFMYFLLPELTPGTYYLEMEPATANRADSRLASDVAGADVLLLTNEWDNWNEPNASRQYGSPRPNDLRARLFCDAGDSDSYRLFIKC